MDLIGESRHRLAQMSRFLYILWYSEVMQMLNEAEVDFNSSDALLYLPIYHYMVSHHYSIVRTKYCTHIVWIGCSWSDSAGRPPPFSLLVVVIVQK